MTALTYSIICGILSLVCLVISIMQFKEKGFLFNNAYIWVSAKERAAMDKKPHYRQSGIVFAICATIFIVVAIECIFLTRWLWIIVAALSIAVIVYAIASSIKESLK